MRKLSLFLSLFFLVSTIAFADEAAQFQLTSPAFVDNAEIPVKYTCRGGNLNPPLELKNVPLKAKSIAIAIFDPDAQEGRWVHWAAYNISPNVVSIPENFTPTYQTLNDFGKYNYEGPCPTDDRLHHYVIRAYAVDALLEPNESWTLVDLEKALSSHTISKTDLIGLYRKPIW